MITRIPTVAPPAAATAGGRLTGTKVLLLLVGFFGLVTLVNVFMITAAISTFGGVDTPSSYQAGLTYKAEEAAAAAQAARNWSVDARLTGSGDAEVVTLDVADETGAPVSGAEVTARLAHPIDERRDQPVVLTAIGPGTYSGTVTAAPGQWILDITVARHGAAMFRSQNRVILPTGDR